MSLFRDTKLLAFDIDGTLTDGTTTWLGPEHGFAQTYSTRDGESMLRLRHAGIHVLPLSRNQTACAKARMTGLGLDIDFLGVPDKAAAMDLLLVKYSLSPDCVAYIGDGHEDALVFAKVGVGCAVADAHPIALRAARHVTRARGGQRALEELAELILRQRAEVPVQGRVSAGGHGASEFGGS